MTKTARSYRFLAMLALLALLATAGSLGRDALAQGNTIYVDADATGNNNGTSWEDAFTTLQPALDEAADGDEIWVAEGIYTPTQESSPGDPRSAAFQLKNGVALYGGFDPTVGDVAWEDRDWVSNVITLSGDIGTAGDPADNSYHVFYHPSELALDGTAVLDGFTVNGGNADDDDWPNYAGGGIYNSGSSPAVTNCTLSDNSAMAYGGGMYNEGSSPAVANCTFLGNSAFGGGGMYNDGSSPAVTDCTFSGNSTSWGGGGMLNYSSSSPAVTDCTFSANSAPQGGGMYNTYSSSPSVTNCTFSGNSAYRGGGMYDIFSASPSVTNCTFSGNSAGSGGGMANISSSSASVTNCILWGDSPDETYNEDSEPAVTYSDIQGGCDGTGNIDADPLFVDPGSGDYHLGPGSPCIDAGTNDAPNLPDYDFEGDPRVMDGNHDGMAVVDMGIDEAMGIPPDVIFVDQDAAGGNDGTSWEDAYTALQPALDEAADGDQIWVAEGTYMPTYQFSPGDPRSATFQLKNGVALYGGFDPTVGDVGWDDRDWVGNGTILSGDIGTAGDSGDNSYHVFYHQWGLALDGSAVLDGFTVTGGNADGAEEPNFRGGGMYNGSSSPQITNCTFSDNSADWGGGMANLYSSPAVTTCIFRDNSADMGGGMYNLYSSSLTVTNCTFSGNSADSGSCGGMANSYSSPAVINCTFSGNSAGDSGGGMCNGYHSSPAVTNCAFSDNSAGNAGGGMFNLDTSSPAVTNCTFSGNSAQAGGGMANRWQDSSPSVTNSILWGDSPDEISSEGGEPVVSYSDIQGGYDGTGNIDTDPLFMDPSSGDYHLGPGSPCIDAGTNDAPNLPQFDFEGDPRVMDGNGDGAAVVDVGVDEVYGYALYLPLVFRDY